MKNFDIETPCLKCGYAFSEAFIEYKVGVFDVAGQENISTIHFGEPIDAYLLRICRRCGYKWPERTIDNEESI